MEDLNRTPFGLKESFNQTHFRFRGFKQTPFGLKGVKLNTEPVWVHFGVSSPLGHPVGV